MLTTKVIMMVMVILIAKATAMVRVLTANATAKAKVSIATATAKVKVSTATATKKLIEIAKKIMTATTTKSIVMGTGTGMVTAKSEVVRSMALVPVVSATAAACNLV